jgi:K(+)-stimulated pyrophosphate-energized sodium pump
VSYIWIPIVIGLLAVAFAAYLAGYALRKDTGTTAMQKVADAIYKGAAAFLHRQYRTIALFAVFAAIIVATVLFLLTTGSTADKFDLA